MTICETEKGSELTSNERTLIDRCVKETYHEFITSHGDMSKIPTFTDFYKNLVAMTEIEAKSLALSLELYITGYFNIFSGRTNINTDKRFLVFDISSMGEQIRPVGLQVVLEYVWQRVSKNRDNGIRTWVWIDEFSIMFNDGAGKTTHRSGGERMIWFLLIFIVIDIVQTLYIRHLKKEIAFRDGESNTEDKPTTRPKKENRVIKLIKEVFWI